MPNYFQSLQSHLIGYKRDRLGITERGVFRHRGRDVEYEHILPLALKWDNLLPGWRSSIQAHVEARKLTLHRYFHHLNSSQAFAFNLFFPFFSSGSPEADSLLRALGQDVGFAPEEWAFEKVVNEDEGTNADVTWVDLQGHCYYCEVKLSEQEFGCVKPVGGDLPGFFRATGSY